MSSIAGIVLILAPLMALLAALFTPGTPLLGICGLSHRKAYFDIFVVAMAFPLVVLVAVVALGTAVWSF